MRITKQKAKQTFDFLLEITYNCPSITPIIFQFPWRNSPQWTRAFSLPRLQDHTPHSIGLLWSSDQPAGQTSTGQLTTLTKDRHPCSRRHSNPAILASERLHIHALGRTATIIIIIMSPSVEVLHTHNNGTYPDFPLQSLWKDRENQKHGRALQSTRSFQLPYYSVHLHTPLYFVCTI